MRRPPTVVDPVEDRPCEEFAHARRHDDAGRERGKDPARAAGMEVREGEGTLPASLVDDAADEASGEDEGAGAGGHRPSRKRR